MGKPGSGRYTTYVPPTSDKVSRLKKLFPVINSVNNASEPLYNAAATNSAAAEAARELALSQLNKGLGDPDMFPAQAGQPGVPMNFSGAPDTTKVTWDKSADPSAQVQAGRPANPYFPDLTSPGPGKTDGTDKDSDPEIEPADIKPKFTYPTVNTTSPSATASKLGSFSLGEDLQKGKSSQS